MPPATPLLIRTYIKYNMGIWTTLPRPPRLFFLYIFCIRKIKHIFISILRNEERIEIECNTMYCDEWEQSTFHLWRKIEQFEITRLLDSFHERNEVKLRQRSIWNIPFHSFAHGYCIGGHHVLLSGWFHGEVFIGRFPTKKKKEQCASHNYIPMGCTL